LLREHYTRPSPLLEAVEPHTLEERQEALNNALTATDKSVRSLIQRLRNTIELYTEEFGIANAGDTAITLQPQQTVNITLVHTVIFCGVLNDTWTLTLGQRVMQFKTPTTWQSLPSNPRFILKADEKRVLQLGGAAAGGGDCFLWIMGTQLPEGAIGH
jgi:hypothetical protein